MKKSETNLLPAPDQLRALLDGRTADPHSILGMHSGPSGRMLIRVFDPMAEAVTVFHGKEFQTAAVLTKIHDAGLFAAEFPVKKFFAYEVEKQFGNGTAFRSRDPYSFLPAIGEMDLYLFNSGEHHNVYNAMGAHCMTVDGVTGVRFTVWAPNAERVSVVGNFNCWDGRRSPMRLMGNSGIWELFIPSIEAGEVYKYEIRTRNGDVFTKLDPYAWQTELRPSNAGIVANPAPFQWTDSAWLEKRAATDIQHSPMNIYEVHLASWQGPGTTPTTGKDDFNNYRQLAHALGDYVLDMGYTHIELLPICEHPLDQSWGYQVTGFYAPTARFGTPEDFAYFVNHMHSLGIGVILDWVPAHFPKDAFSLGRFDGTALYEHADPRQGEQKDWGTYVFNFGRNEVRGFLIGSALYWLDRFHVDGLRVDAVASMLYLNFSRDNWIPNKYGGSENLDAIDFLKHVNSVIHSDYPGTITIAEESTTFAGVTKPVGEGGLGFDFKWNLGWMHDTLDYLKEDPINRKYHHNKMTFPSMFQFTEKFMLVYSHDEVVHGKSPMVGKMGSGYWDDKIATLRALYAYMWMWPGKKTLFMGDEIAQGHEWRYDESLEWSLLKYIQHEGVRESVRDVAKLYLSDAELAENDFNSIGFEWINADDGDNSVFSFLRFTSDGKRCYATVSNFTPVEQRAYRLGLPCGGVWKEVLNTDAKTYGGGGRGNMGKVEAVAEKAANRRPFGCDMVVPPLSTVVLLGYL